MPHCHTLVLIINFSEQSSAESEIAKLQAQVSELTEQVAALTGQLTVLKLKDSSPESTVEHAAALTKEDTAECFKGLHNATSANYYEFQPNEGNLIQQIIEHFSTAKLSLIDTHERGLTSMDNKPDICVVVNKPKSQPSALSVVAVIELTKENLKVARGHLIKDLLELADLQPNRTSFPGIFADKEQVGFLRLIKTANAANPVSFVQSAMMPWSEGLHFNLITLANLTCRINLVVAVFEFRCRPSWFHSSSGIENRHYDLHNTKAQTFESGFWLHDL